MLIGIAFMLLAACGGETEVQGGGVGTGPTATGPTATGPTAETAETDPFGGPVQLDLTNQQNPTGAAMYSCDGIEGTWTYEPGKHPVEGVEMTIGPSPVDMSGGEGTLVIEGEITIPGWGARGSRARYRCGSRARPMRRRWRRVGST